MKRLVTLLIAKSVLDTILVGVIAVVVYLDAFPPTFYGWGEAVKAERTVAGWVVSSAEPSRRVEVQLFVDGTLAGTQVAELRRPDVRAAGWSKDEFCGYRFALPALNSGAHEARVYALHQSENGGRYTLQLLGDPIRFEVNADGSWR